MVKKRRSTKTPPPPADTYARLPPDAVLGTMLMHVAKILPFRKDLGTYVDDVFVLGVAVGLLFDRAALVAGWRPR